jgi:hypothetical protein
MKKEKVEKDAFTLAIINYFKRLHDNGSKARKLANGEPKDS